MIDKTISHYKIVKKLGEGGMGEVYLAEDTSLKREVAIKVLPQTLRKDPERLARFRREAEAAVGPGPEGLTVAVASAVARLRGFPSPVRTATNTRDVDGTTVVTVLLELPGGEKAAGAAIVTGGLPFTVGRAVDSALTAL